MTKELTSSEIAQIRNHIIDRFCEIEEWINLAIFYHYRIVTYKKFVEEVLMSGKNGFGLKIELFRNMILENGLLEKKECQSMLEELRELIKIRNYIAHTPFSTTMKDDAGKELVRKEMSLDFGNDLRETLEHFDTIYNEYLPKHAGVIGFVMNHLASENKK